jgi:hypothetical protein
MKIGDNSVNARGLSKAELQEVIDSAVTSKNKSFQDLLEDMKESLLLLMELDPGYTEHMLELIKKRYPKQLKAAMQEVDKK